jgi:hypothetical protein
VSHQPITPEALSGALAAVRGLPLPGDPEHTVRSPFEPTWCACGEKRHAGTTWINTGASEGFEEAEREAIRQGVSVHCAMCGEDLGTQYKPGDGHALFRAHLPHCPNRPADVNPE